MKKILFLLALLLSTVDLASGQVKPVPAPTPNASHSPFDCVEAPPSTNPRARRFMKFRGPQAGMSYTRYNNGKPIDLAEWFSFTCGLSKSVTATPEDKPIEGAENIELTLRGYVLAVKFMRTGDGDINVELGSTPAWDADHMVVEMSQGKDFCKARQTLWKLAKKDGCAGDECILKKPVPVEVRGYIMLGQVPQGTTDYCNAISARGVKDDTHTARVRGIWRLQPVLALRKL